MYPYNIYISYCIQGKIIMLKDVVVVIEVAIAIIVRVLKHHILQR